MNYLNISFAVAAILLVIFGIIKAMRNEKLQAYVLPFAFILILIVVFGFLIVALM
ncbi:hypothetical protein [Haloplasma contractile]|uniref:Uncharacterized protein n=1 Tax=Haloplasma contractile SSD-17B TaxID=1033810 RepID=U2DTZ2_9MOLU|nr:hypothetical protein [Haloplasma contractile]ERJ11922.1 hypothetical protein HLPCO_002162 [Haloplasma contractile SSD-17B]